MICVTGKIENIGLFSQEGRFFVYSTVFDTIGAKALKMNDVVKNEIEHSTDDTAESCPMPDIAKLIGGKWKLIILQVLIFKGTKRFNELRRLCDGVTQTMLTNQLRALERDGLVTRKVYAQVPPRVEYSATQKARDLTQMFHCMHDWWVKHV